MSVANSQTWVPFARWLDTWRDLYHPDGRIGMVN
jgi:hypothetical protein